MVLSRPGNLALLYLMELCAGTSRGAFLVCIGWSTLIGTGDVAVVGQVFVLGMLTNMFAGPFLGTFSDRHNRARVAFGAHAGLAIVMLGAGVLIAVQAVPGPWVFYGTTIAAYVLRSLYQMAHDGLIKANAAAVSLVQTVARARTIHLIATALGTVLTGVVIDQFGVFWGFAVSALGSAALLLPVMLLRGGEVNDQARIGFLSDLLEGFRFVLGHSALRGVVLLAAVALPVGQLSNAILSSRIHDDLGKGSAVFGLVDAAWPVGGMIAAAIMSVAGGALSRGVSIFVFSGLAGLSTVALSQSHTVALLVVSHAVMGVCVWFCHILIDARVLELAGQDRVGRAKAGVQFAMALCALVMCLSPSVARDVDAATLFLFWGSVIMIATIVLAWRARAFRT